MLTALLTASLLTLLAPPADPDTDHDGLPDFQEIHKYLTDPAKADTDGDGIPDFDPAERREYAYTLRLVLDVIKPINPAALTDDYQDARVLEDHDDYARIEVISYPFNSNADAIAEKSDWRAAYAADPALHPYLVPGVTCNFDDAMRDDLLTQLAADRIDVATLTDRETAELVSKWLMKRAHSEDSFTTFGVEFPDGHPRVAAPLQANVNHELQRRGRTLEEQWDHELLGKGMFRTRTIGSCTSTAIYLATCLKAVGLPTRTIICIPALDANDDSERALAAALTNHRVRRIIERSAAQQKGSWTSHTFNEVYVGNRWRRLNYTRLGQNTLDEGFLGLMVHVHTYTDHSDAGLVTWGLRDASNSKKDICGYANPYSCVEISDQFGRHCTLDNPSAE